MAYAFPAIDRVGKGRRENHAALVMELFSGATTVAVFVFLVVVNAATYLVYWVDKDQGQNRGHRISEQTLLFLALVGGSPAALFACHHLRHKTNKQPFRTLLIGVAGLQVGAVGYRLLL